jgi:hypothetical protein
LPELFAPLVTSGVALKQAGVKRLSRGIDIPANLDSVLPKTPMAYEIIVVAVF